MIKRANLRNPSARPQTGADALKALQNKATHARLDVLEAQVATLKAKMAKTRAAIAALAASAAAEARRVTR